MCDLRRPKNKRQAGNSRCDVTLARDSGRRWGFSESSEPNLLAPWMEGDPKADKPLPSVTLAKICFLWPFPQDGRGMAWGRAHSPPPPCTVVGGAGASHLLPSILCPPAPAPLPLLSRWDRNRGPPDCLGGGVQQKSKEREAGGRVRGSFLSFFLPPLHPQHTQECVPANFLPSFLLRAIPGPGRAQPAARPCPCPGKGVSSFF